MIRQLLVLVGTSLWVWAAAAQEVPADPAPAPAEPAPADPVAPAPPAEAAAPSPAEDQRILVLQFAAGAVDENTVRVLNELVVAELGALTPREIVTFAEIENLVNLEVSRAAMQCDASACLAEVAGALGIRYVVFGSAGQLGDRTVLTVSLFDSDEARNLSRETLRVDDVNEFEEELRPAMARLIAPLDGEVVLEDEGGLGSVWLWAGLGTAGLGTVALLSGLACFGASEAILFAWPGAPGPLKSGAVIGELAGPAAALAGAVGLAGGVALLTVAAVGGE